MKIGWSALFLVMTLPAEIAATPQELPSAKALPGWRQEPIGVYPRGSVSD